MERITLTMIETKDDGTEVATPVTAFVITTPEELRALFSDTFLAPHLAETDPSKVS